MALRFTKMHGLGNDFVIIDLVRQRVELPPEQVRRLADRHFGIGCDQVLLVEPSTRDGVDFRYRIFNRDGGEVEQCGNGARCFARFVRDQGLSAKDEITVETRAGLLRPRLEADGRVTVDMGVPTFNPAEVPFTAPARADRYPLTVDGETVEVSVLAIGNPHAVLIVPDSERAPVLTLGPKIEHHPGFPKRVNVGFLQIIDAGHVRLRVWERGAGETLACGSGACAAVAAGRVRGLLDDRVTVSLPGGVLDIRWPGEGQPLWMTGPAVTVYEGTIDLDRL